MFFISFGDQYVGNHIGNNTVIKDIVGWGSIVSTSFGDRYVGNDIGNDIVCW